MAQNHILTYSYVFDAIHHILTGDVNYEEGRSELPNEDSTLNEFFLGAVRTADEFLAMPANVAKRDEIMQNAWELVTRNANGLSEDEELRQLATVPQSIRQVLLALYQSQLFKNWSWKKMTGED